MKYLRKDFLFIKIFAFIISVIILFLSPFARYFDIYHIDKIHAAGAPVVAEGAVIAWEWLMGLLASAGLGAVAYENREALASSYDEYLQAQIDTDMFIAHKVEDTCIQLYDKASDTVQNIPWDDYLNSINEFHDVAVDELTDIYVKVSPSLLGTFEDFITSVFNGTTYVPGFSDSVNFEAFIGYDNMKNPDGTYNVVGSSFWKEEASASNIYTVYRNYTPYTLSKPAFIIPSASSGNPYPQYAVWYFSGNMASLRYDQITTYSTGKVTTKTSSSSMIGSSVFAQNFSMGINLPVFSSMEAAEAAYANGDYSSALNYSRSIYDNITDNDDLPTIGRFGRELWEQVANAPDWGIGSYGDGAIVNDWATDLPFVGLEDLWNYALTAEDVYDKVIDDIINGVYDPTIDIPDTYDDAWHDVIDKGWDDVIDNPVNNPAKDPSKPVDPSIPVNPSIPIDPSIPIELPDIIDVPIESVVPTINDSLFDVASSIKYKFPFSIPWDLRYLFTVLAGTPKAPYFELPLVIKGWGIDELIIVDMKRFQVLSNLSRSLFSLIFAIGLIKLTFWVVGMRKEE